MGSVLGLPIHGNSHIIPTYLCNGVGQIFTVAALHRSQWNHFNLKASFGMAVSRNLRGPFVSDLTIKIIVYWVCFGTCVDSMI